MRSKIAFRVQFERPGKSIDFAEAICSWATHPTEGQ